MRIIIHKYYLILILQVSVQDIKYNFIIAVKNSDGQMFRMTLRDKTHQTFNRTKCIIILHNNNVDLRHMIAEHRSTLKLYKEKKKLFDIVK